VAEPLDSRVALVTGASGGIGREIALRLGAEGAAVAAHYGSGRERAEEVVAAIEAAGGRAVAVGADLAQPEACGGLVDAVERELGSVEVLVSNAGAGEVTRLDDVTLDEWDRVQAVNLRAPFLLAQRVVPAMRERRFGRILMVSSVAAFTGGVVGPHYAASKAGLHGLTHFLSSRLAKHAVTANAIAPALVEGTGMLPGDPGGLAERIPVRRLGRPEEIADMAVAMLRNAYLTNQVVSVDGGMHPH
jgi:3-oxoacyl-[acyl-carrier protein] reductase